MSRRRDHPDREVKRNNTPLGKVGNTPTKTQAQADRGKAKYEETGDPLYLGGTTHSGALGANPVARRIKDSE